MRTKTSYYQVIDLPSILCIAVETENAAYERFDGAHAVHAQPAKEKLTQTATGGEIYAKPEKKKIASNAADTYSSVDKSKRKGFRTYYNANSICLRSINKLIINKTFKALHFIFHIFATLY